MATAYVSTDAARVLAAGGLSSNFDAAPVTMTFTSWASDDGGDLWVRGGSFSVVQDPGLSWGGDLDFVNAEDGWFSANQDDTDTSLGMTLFRTVNGGADWERVAHLAAPPSSVPACSTEPTATFASPTTGWLTGGGCEQAEFEVTHDGGETWSPQALPLLDAPSLVLERPVFISRQVGVLPAFPGGGGGPVTVYVTVDGGGTWTPHQAPSGELPVAVDFINADDGWLLSADTFNAGFPAGLYATHDGGRAWSTLEGLEQGVISVSGTVFDTSTLDFVSPTLGWTLGRTSTFTGTGDELLQTADGGRTWRAVTVQVSGASA